MNRKPKAKPAKFSGPNPDPKTPFVYDQPCNTCRYYEYKGTNSCIGCKPPNWIQRPESKYLKAVNSIVDDLTDRRGLRQEWDQIDEETIQEIKDKWAELIERDLENSK